MKIPSRELIATVTGKPVSKRVGGRATFKSDRMIGVSGKTRSMRRVASKPRSMRRVASKTRSVRHVACEAASATAHSKAVGSTSAMECAPASVKTSKSMKPAAASAMATTASAMTTTTATRNR